MRSIIPCHSSCLPLHSQLRHSQELKAKPRLRLFGSEASRFALLRQNIPSSAPLRTNATIANSLLLSAISTPKSPDLTVLSLTSALLLLMYGIANFVVPHFISKNFEFDEVSEDQKANTEDKPGR